MSTSHRRPASRVATRILIVFEEWLPGALMAVMAIAITSDVVMRYIFNAPLAGAGEIAMFSMIWMVYLGSAAVSRKGAHICLDFFSERIGARGRALLDITVELITIAVLGVIFFATIQYLQDAKFLILPGTGISKQYITLAAAVGLGLMLLHTIAHLWRAVVGLRDDGYWRINIPVEDIELDEFNTQVIRAVGEELTGRGK